MMDLQAGGLSGWSYALQIRMVTRLPKFEKYAEHAESAHLTLLAQIQSHG